MSNACIEYFSVVEYINVFCSVDEHNSMIARSHVDSAKNMTPSPHSVGALCESCVRT